MLYYLKLNKQGIKMKNFKITGKNGVLYPLDTFLDVQEKDYINLTEFCSKTGMDKHRILRLLFVKQCRKESINGNALIITTTGNGGKALFHKVLIPYLLSILDINYMLRFNSYILENLSNIK